MERRKPHHAELASLADKYECFEYTGDGMAQRDVLTGDRLRRRVSWELRLLRLVRLVLGQTYLRGRLFGSPMTPAGRRFKKRNLHGLRLETSWCCPVSK